jgi:hypothetical protein
MLSIAQRSKSGDADSVAAFLSSLPGGEEDGLPAVKE